MSYRPRLRGAVIGACTAALLAGSGLLALPVQAASSQVSAAVAQRSTPSETTSAAFVQEYIWAIGGSHPDGLDHLKVREKFFSKELDAALFAWEGEHKTNPVFRRDDEPKSYALWEKSQENGDAKVLVTYTWPDDTTSDIWLTIGLASQVITGLADTA